MRQILSVLLILCAGTVAAAQPDYGREKRWADEITPALLVGDPVYLTQKSGHKFLTLHARNAKARAGVIVVHGLGVHPDWNLNNPLRSQLAEQGYATLSVQMPVYAADADRATYPTLFPDAAERLQVAVAFLREQGHRKIALVSHSMGARMANHFLVNTAQPGVDAWVAIGLLGEYVQPAKLTSPILDIYGEKDFPDVLALASKRAAALRAIRGSGQIQVAGTDHFFNGAEAELVQHIKRFLDIATR